MRTMGRNIPWLPAEEEALKAFVKERTGDELAPVGPWNSAWADLAKRWKALGKVKGFQTDRSVEAMYGRLRYLRKKAGRVDSLPVGSKNPWSAEEEKALLDFVKERKGDEMAFMGSKVAFNKLKNAWKKSKGFDTARSANAMYLHHNKMRKERAEQTATTPQPSPTSSTTSATAQAPSLSSSGRKRNASAAALTTSPPSSDAKKSKPSPSASASLAAMKSDLDEALRALEETRKELEETREDLEETREDLEETREDLEECRETSMLLQLALDSKMTAIDGLNARVRELEEGA